MHGNILLSDHIHWLQAVEWSGAPVAPMKARGQRYVQFTRTTGDRLRWPGFDGHL